MVWVVDTRDDCSVTALEESQGSYHDGVLEFSKVADSDIYECKGNMPWCVPLTVHAITPNGVVSCNTPCIRAFVEAMLSAEKLRVFAGHVALLSGGDIFPYSMKDRRFVSIEGYMKALDEAHYPLKEIVDYIRRMRNVQSECVQTT